MKYTSQTLESFRYFVEQVESFKDLEVTSIILKTNIIALNCYLKNYFARQTRKIVFFGNNSLLATCKANGKEYQVGQSFIDDNCTASCTCSAGDRVACISLCPPTLVICKKGEKKEQYKEYIPGSKCFCNRECCVKGNCIIVL